MARSPRAACLALCLAFGTSALPIAARADRGEATIAITFTGSSTLHDFEGAAAPLRVAIESRPDGTWASEVVVPVASLDTGIRARDENLRAMLDAPHHPEILGRFRDVDPETARRLGVLPFLLRIRDVERPVKATLSHWREDGDHADFDAVFDVSLAAFGLEAPRVLFMRVADTVHVTVHVTLERT